MGDHFREQEDFASKHGATRRNVLKGVLAGAAAGAVGVTSQAVALPSSSTAPAFGDLTRYYAFLWKELHGLSTEMGVEMCDSTTANRNGDTDVLKAHLSAPPSTRAKAVMRSIGADCETLKAVGDFPAAAAEMEPKFDLQNWLDTADPIAVADYHAARLAKVMALLDPTRAYRFHIDADKGFALVVGDPLSAEQIGGLLSDLYYVAAKSNPQAPRKA